MRALITSSGLMALKTGFCSLITVEVAVNLSVLTFNHGMDGLLPLVERVVGSPPGAHTTEFFALQDAKRVMKAHQKTEVMSQRQRKSLRSGNLAVEESHIAQEGTTYQAGGF